MATLATADELWSACECIYGDQLAEMDIKAFRAEFQRWHHTPVRLAGRIVALISTLDSEIHVGVDPLRRRHWFPFKAFRQRMNELIGHHGRVTTVDWEIGGRSHAFILRLGFSLERVDSPVIRYVRTRPYGRVDGPREASHA